MAMTRRPDWTKSGIRQFCKVKKEKATIFKVFCHWRSVLLKDIAKELCLSTHAVSVRIFYGNWFSEGEYRKIKEMLKVSDDELSRYFEFSKEALEMIERSGNGYKMDFTVNNETRTAYGKSEIECRKNAEKRKQELKSKNEESVRIVISKYEAMLLSFYLLKGVKEGKPTGDDKTILTSIYMRIATALI